MPPLLPFSLDALRSHAIFVPPASSSTDDGWELVDSQPSLDGLPAPKNSRIAVRDRDLIVAFGKEIRMTSIAGEGWEIRGASVGGYKVGLRSAGHNLTDRPSSLRISLSRSTRSCSTPMDGCWPLWVSTSLSCLSSRAQALRALSAAMSLAGTFVDCDDPAPAHTQVLPH